METAEISANKPLPVFVTNEPAGTSTGTLPDYFKVGNTLTAHSLLGGGTFKVIIKQVEGSWILCDFTGSYQFTAVWLHVPAIGGYIWEKA